MVANARPRLNKEKTQKQQKETDKPNADQGDANNESFLRMRLEKGNNLFLLVTDNKGMASTKGKVHDGVVRFPINCFTNVGEECVLCRLYEHYISEENFDAAKKYKPKIKYVFHGLDWKIFNDEPPGCLGNLEDDSKYDADTKKCNFCSHVPVCKKRFYAVSILPNCGPEIFNPLLQILTDPDSDPTDIEGARLLNIKRNAEGMNRPEGMSKYYEPVKMSDSDGGRINLCDENNKWILDVIEDTAVDDLYEIFNPNTSTNYVVTQLSEEDKAIVGQEYASDESQSQDDTGGNGSDSQVGEELGKPDCFGDKESFSETDTECIGGGNNNMEPCFHFEECRDLVKQKGDRQRRRGARGARR